MTESTPPPPCGWLADAAHYTNPPPAAVRVQMGWHQGPQGALMGLIMPLCASCAEARRAEMEQVGGRFAITAEYT